MPPPSPIPTSGKTLNACEPEEFPQQELPQPELLRPSRGGDGSFSLWSGEFEQGFHSGRGALREARETFVDPAQLERFAPGSTVVALDLCVGTGSNTAALLERCAALGLRLRWWGIELDRQPLQLALADGQFQSQWPPEAIEPLRQLGHGGPWHSPLGQGQMLWGDARERLPELIAAAAGSCHLVMHDAFSPQRCPQLWSLEFLAGLAQLLLPGGRLLTYSSAAAVRRSLQLVGLQLAAIRHHEPAQQSPGAWSGGTAASPTPLASCKFLRPLGAMEWEHLATNGAEPYRDPDGTATAAMILASRALRQRSREAQGGVESTSAWRRRWGLEADRRSPPIPPGRVPPGGSA
jgi:hypothetical protein